MGEIRDKIRPTNIRPKRAGSRGPLYFPEECKEPGYEYRWEAVSDRNHFGLTEAKIDGWEFVPREHLIKFKEVLGDNDISQNYGSGDYIEAGGGAGIKHYLMRIRKEIYLENQAADELEREEKLKTKDDELMSVKGAYKRKDIHNLDN